MRNRYVVNAKSMRRCDQEEIRIIIIYRRKNFCEKQRLSATRYKDYFRLIILQATENIWKYFRALALPISPSYKIEFIFLCHMHLVQFILKTARVTYSSSNINRICIDRSSVQFVTKHISRC